MAKKRTAGQEYAVNCFDAKGGSQDYFSEENVKRVEDYGKDWLDGQENGSYVILLKPFKRIDKIATYETSAIK